MTTLSKWRINYPDNPIRQEDIEDRNPIRLFKEWLAQALEDKVVEPNAMTIATISNDNTPDCRTVLLKEVDLDGFIFYTNYNSQKGQQIQFDANIAASFWWPQSHRQVRIRGQASKIPHERSEAYFHLRDRETQIGAWASNQSEKIPDYQFLRDRFQQLKEKFKDQKIIPCPPHWGGYSIRPMEIEFWQGCTSRLHDRILFTRENIETYKWQVSRLSP